MDCASVQMQSNAQNTPLMLQYAVVDEVGFIYFILQASNKAVTKS